MTWSMGRALLVSLGIGLCGGMSAWQITQAQVAIEVVQPAAPAGGPPATEPTAPADANDLNQAITLPTDSNLKQKLEACRDYVRDTHSDQPSHFLHRLFEHRAAH